MRRGRRCWRWALLALLAGAVATGDGVLRAGEQPRLVFESERLAPPEIQARADSLKLAITDVGNMRLVVSNAGTFGRGFDSRQNPSMEWPARSGIDHLVRGAVWVGAISVTTGDTLVTTGGRDAFYLDPIFQHSEFTPVRGEPPREFSRLRTSPFFRPGTVSDENLRTAFVDTVPVVKVGSFEEEHTPMGIEVQQNTYGWGFDPVDDLVIVELNVINIGEAGLQDLWIGIYSEFVTNNRNFYRTWPPGGAWFDFQCPQWERNTSPCQGSDEFTARLFMNRKQGGANTGASQWGGMKILGSGGSGPFGRGPDSISTKKITLTGWSWSPTTFLTWSDDSLYTFMSRGKTNWPEGIPDPTNTEINPSSIIAVGPFPLVAPGDTVQVVWSFIAGEDEADLRQNAFWAQKAYDDGYALPSPPSPPILRVFPQHRQVVLRWSEHPESELDPATRLLDFQGYRVYLSETPLAADFRLAREFDVRDGIGFDTGLESARLAAPFVTAEGDSLWYELALGGIPDGFKRYVSITSYDFQDGVPQTLEGGVLSNSVYFITGPSQDEARASGHRVSVFPNPYRGTSEFDGRDAQGEINPRRRVLWFVNLPPKALLKIYTLAGDLVREYDYDAATYGGTETAGISPDRSDLAVGRRLVTSGSMAGFDLLNTDGQEIASGLYIFTVRDKDTGDTQQGKFMVLR